MKNLIIASLNVCLGLFNKLDYVKQCLRNYDIDILFVQECEISQLSDHNIYTIPNYELSLPKTIKQGKARLCVYIRSEISVSIIIPDDFIELITVRITGTDCTIHGFYRPFKLISHQGYSDYMNAVITHARTHHSNHTLFMGDFNLDLNRKNDARYQSYELFNQLENYLVEKSMICINTETTW